MRYALALPLAALAALSAASCKTTASHPCTLPTAGQAAHDGPPGKGTKQCIQVKDGTGHYVNHGKYIEWFPDGKRWIQGEYKYGLKHGKWSEWDEQGKLVSEHWWEDGVMLPDRDTHPPSPAPSFGPGIPAATVPARPGPRSNP